MNAYCTLFDSYYLTRGLALYESLRASGEEFVLIVYCFDDLAYEVLSALNLPEMRLVRLREFETPELLAVKSDRTRGEYCWTCTPHILADSLKRFRLQEVTYLDADLFFFQKPAQLLDEFRASGASVMITEHRYAPQHDQSATAGIYCVQFVTVANDVRGNAVLTWWGERCLEWCYARFEQGRFGDQKYLDDWLVRFEGVHVLQNLGGGVAPWNVERYAVSSGPCVDGKPVVFFHYHSLKWLKTGGFELCGEPYRLSGDVRQLVYEPYLAVLRKALERVRAIYPDFDSGKADLTSGFRARWRHIRRRFRGEYPFVPE